MFADIAPMLVKRIGANIEAARKKRRLSAERLAAMVEPPTSYQHIRRLERGSDALNFEWVERIAKALAIDPMDLIAPELAARGAFSLDEQVASDVAMALAVVAREGDEPEPGIVQALSLMLQELFATFSEHPTVAADAERARPLLTLVGRRFAPLAN
jgi:transcriptional regulator with XRE-family HTH domain